MKENKENEYERCLEGRKITVGICACGVVSEIFNLLHLLKKSGAEIEIILTPNAAEIMPLVLLQRLSSKPILYNQMDLPKTFDNKHKEKIDLLLIAPATANTVSKIAGGIADNLLTSRVLSAKSPVALIVNCNSRMYNKPVIKRNVDIIKNDGLFILNNDEKPNKMPSPEKIIEGICNILSAVDL